MADTPAILRHWTLLKILSVRRLGASYQELEAETGAVRRTIQRDMVFLSGLGFPLTEILGENGLKRWKIEEGIGLTQLRFTLEEAAALYLGRQFLEPLAGTLFHSGARSAFYKIQSTLGEAALRHLEKLASSFYHARQGWTDYTLKARLIDDLAIAIEERKLSVITYQSLRATEPVTLYDVFPYALVFHRDALYLIAYSKDHDQIRTFKVDRISSIDIHELRFPAPKDFNPQQFLEHSFGIFQSDGQPTTVRVSFRGKVTRILEEKRFHPSQKLTPQNDGSVIAEFQLSTFEEFISWILSFGPAAEVLEPADLRSRIIEQLNETAGRYNQSESSLPAVSRRRKKSSGPRQPR